MAHYGLIKSFDIDNGELDDLTRKHCFVLGYELAQIDSELAIGKEINKPVHAENRERIHKSCMDAGRPFRLKWVAADPAEAWMQLNVQGELSEEV